MMLIDALLEFSDEQQLSGAGASDKVIDLGQAKPTPGVSKVLDIAVTVAEDVTGSLQIKVQHCDTEDGTFEDVVASATYTAPEAGTKIVVECPYATKRYLRVYYGGSPTSGTVNAALLWGAGYTESFAQAESQKNLWPTSGSVVADA